MPTPATAPALVCSVGHRNHWRCGSVVILHARGLMWLGQGEALLFPVDVNFGLGDQYAVQDLARLSGRPVGRVGVRGR